MWDLSVAAELWSLEGFWNSATPALRPVFCGWLGSWVEERYHPQRSSSKLPRRAHSRERRATVRARFPWREQFDPCGRQLLSANPAVRPNPDSEAEIRLYRRRLPQIRQPS